jgi:hypothetical protein
MSDAVARPSLFILKARYSKVYCPEPDYEDLWVEIRTNLSHDERRDFIEASNAIRDKVQAYLESRLDTAVKLDDAYRAATNERERLTADARRRAFLDEQDAGIAELRRERLTIAAPFIRAWNVGTEENTDAAPPAVSGDAAFDYIDDVTVTWILTEIERGYRGGKGVRTSLKRSADSPEQVNEPQTVSEKAVSS